VDLIPPEKAEEKVDTVRISDAAMMSDILVFILSP
jgi:hypothetical protein